MIFDRKAFDAAILTLCDHYEKTAPTVADWADALHSRPDRETTLAEIHLVATLSAELPPPSYAANPLYHLAILLGHDTTG